MNHSSMVVIASIFVASFLLTSSIAFVPYFIGKNMVHAQETEEETMTEGNVTGNMTGNETLSVSVIIPQGSSSPSASIFYDPETLTISKGTNVTWDNVDSTLHTVTSGSAEGAESGTLFDSSFIAAGKTFEWAFNDVGTFDYYCTLHPFMKGKVVVS